MGSLWVITGNGKGKTTFALGMIIKNAMEGKRGTLIQFMKGYPYSEVSFLTGHPLIRVFQTGTPDFVKKGAPLPVDVEEARRGLDIWRELIAEGEQELIILDEINVAIDYGLFPLDEVMEILDLPCRTSLTLFTGRYAHDEICHRAARILEISEIRHPFSKDILARKGIDY